MPIVVDIDVMLARRKMSVGALAERVGITQANLAVLKNGRAKAVRFTTLAALCEVLDCQPGDLLRWEPEEPGERGDPSRGAAVIQVRGLTKRYGDVLAVDDLSFDVEPGKVTGFLGPNGAGKSTTMRMMLGLDRPTSGERAGQRPAVRRRSPNRCARSARCSTPARCIPAGPAATTCAWPPGRNGIAGPARGGGDRAGRARQRRAAQDQGLLARHAPAPRDRRRTARRPARAAVRRADQRARPRRRSLDPRPAASARRRRAAPCWCPAT